MPVVSIREGPDGCSVALKAGEIRARRVLVATNRTSDLLPAYSDRLIKIGSYMIATEPLPPAVRDAIFPEGRTYSTSKRPFNYFRMDPDGRVLFGGRNSLLPDLSDEASRTELEQRMVSLLPLLAQVRVSHSWGGRIAFFRDALPRVGAASPRVFFALGFGGQGLTMATFGGTLAAELILSGATGRAPFNLPLPFQGLLRPSPQSLRLLGWFYRALDAFD
jgi:glycine/D-amino acid oxidase-like deaminating enzyme